MSESQKRGAELRYRIVMVHDAHAGKPGADLPLSLVLQRMYPDGLIGGPVTWDGVRSDFVTYPAAGDEVTFELAQTPAGPSRT